MATNDFELGAVFTPAMVRALATGQLGEAFPSQVGVFCDLCYETDVRDYLVSEEMAQVARFEAARRFLRTQGWRCDAEGDLCPRCVKDVA